MRGTVTAKTNEETGVVSNGSYQTKVGDRFSLYHNECLKEKGADRWARSTKVFCKVKKVGEVEITKVLNERNSEFRTLSAIKFNEGSLIKL